MATLVHDDIIDDSKEKLIIKDAYLLKLIYQLKKLFRIIWHPDSGLKNQELRRNMINYEE